MPKKPSSFDDERVCWSSGTALRAASLAGGGRFGTGRPCLSRLTCRALQHIRLRTSLFRNLHGVAAVGRKKSGALTASCLSAVAAPSTQAAVCLLFVHLGGLGMAGFETLVYFLKGQPRDVWSMPEEVVDGEPERHRDGHR